MSTFGRPHINIQRHQHTVPRISHWKLRRTVDPLSLPNGRLNNLCTCLYKFKLLCCVSDLKHVTCATHSHDVVNCRIPMPAACPRMPPSKLSGAPPPRQMLGRFPANQGFRAGARNSAPPRFPTLISTQTQLRNSDISQVLSIVTHCLRD